MAGAKFTVNSGKTACASAAAKVAVQLATTSTKTCDILGFDVSFDGTSSSATPILVELVRETGVSSTGGTAPTPVLFSSDTSATASTTARINDTTDGTGPTVIAGWFIHPQAGMAYQFPLGREVEMKVSEFLALRITTVAGSGTPNYDATLWFEE